MQQQSERRVSGVRRVSVERVVDVCERDAPGSAFRGLSVDISGRGMQLCASQIPELGAPLVLRFHEQGQEIIAEGEVAWCRQGAAGAEFGVRFTALDSRSVQALKVLCQASVAPAPANELEDGDHDTDPAPPAAPLVRLHIAGLGEPMRAQVRGQGRRGLEVSSQLDFLRLGRSVEVEEATQGARRAARIAGVDVMVDGDSQIPELIVSMRYDEAADVSVAEPLPVTAAAEVAREQPQAAPVARVQARPSAREPLPPRSESEVAVAGEKLGAADEELDPTGEEPDAAREELDPAGEELELDVLARPAGAGRRRVESGDDERAAHGADESHAAETDTDDVLTESERLRERMDGVLRGVSAAARVAGERALTLGGAASRGAHWLAEQATLVTRARTLRSGTVRKRTTSAAPRSALRSNPLLRQQVRPQSSAPARRDARSNRSAARATILGGLFVLAVASGAFFGRSDPPAGADSAAAPAAAPGPAVPATPIPPAPTLPVTEAAPSRAPGPEGEDPGGAESGEVVAQVPLFGPTSVGAEPPAAEEAVPLARVKVDDESFGDAPAPKAPSKRVASTEFGQGRMHLPIVYRLRLNKPGEGLRGERTPTGFDVFIPGRKTMESGTAISRRDDRIAKVVTRNGTEGARVSFRFRGPIPAYKVRLRKDFVEFFISS